MRRFALLLALVATTASAQTVTSRSYPASATQSTPLYPGASTYGYLLYPDLKPPYTGQYGSDVTLTAANGPNGTLVGFPVYAWLDVPSVTATDLPYYWGSPPVDVTIGLRVKNTGPSIAGVRVRIEANPTYVYGEGTTYKTICTSNAAIQNTGADWDSFFVTCTVGSLVDFAYNGFLQANVAPPLSPAIWIPKTRIVYELSPGLTADDAMTIKFDHLDTYVEWPFNLYPQPGPGPGPAASAPVMIGTW